MVIYDFNPQKLPPEYLRAIGLITAASAQTENIVQMLIVNCLGIDGEFGSAVVTRMTSPLRDGVARAVAELRLDDLDALDELDKILDEVNVAFVKRNNAVHHGWCVHPETGDVFTLKTTARNSLRTDLLPMSINEIEADASFVYLAGLRLMDFIIRQGIDQIPIPDRPRAHKTPAARKARRKALGEAALRGDVGED